MWLDTRKALAWNLTWVSNLRLSFFCASICGACKSGITSKYSYKLVEILGFCLWFVVNFSRPWSLKFSNVWVHIEKKKVRKGGTSPFESKLIFSYGCKKMVLKIPDRSGTIDLIRLIKEKRTLRSFFSEEPWTNRPTNCLYYRNIGSDPDPD